MTAEVHDIVIVGAGLVGAALACRLIQDNPGLRIALVEAQVFKPSYAQQSFDHRVVALSAASQQFLQSLGVWQIIASKRLCNYQRMEVWDGSGTGAIEFDCRDVGEDSLGAIVENSIIVEALLERLAASPVTLLCPESVSSIHLPSSNREQNVDQAMIILESGLCLRASLLVATDGANSRLRHLANLKTREWAYGHTAIVCTVETEREHGHAARQCFTPHGPLAFLPLQAQDGDCHFCSIVWSLDHQHAENMLALDDRRFADALADAFEHKLGPVRSVSPRFHFPLTQRHCKDYFKPGLVVAGDAAHTIHPLAGQGVNLGFQDAAVLAEEIHRARQRGLSLTDTSILSRYQRRRQGANLLMMAVMEGFKRLFTPQPPPVHWLRNEGMRQLQKFSVIKKQVIKQAMGIH